MGFALPDDRMHAPNESFIFKLFNGIATCIWFLAAIGARRSHASARQEQAERSEASV
jgi:hypothetical protein